MLFLQLKVQKFVSRHVTILALTYFSTDKHFHSFIENIHTDGIKFYNVVEDMNC